MKKYVIFKNYITFIAVKVGDDVIWWGGWLQMLVSVLSTGNERPMFSYYRSHETLRSHKSSQSPDELDYNTSLAYARDIKKNKQ